jgi:hypothetical protein
MPDIIEGGYCHHGSDGVTYYSVNAKGGGGGGGRGGRERQQEEQCPSPRSVLSAVRGGAGGVGGGGVAAGVGIRARRKGIATSSSGSASASATRSSSRPHLHHRQGWTSSSVDVVPMTPPPPPPPSPRRRIRSRPSPQDHDDHPPSPPPPRRRATTSSVDMPFDSDGGGDDDDVDDCDRNDDDQDYDDRDYVDQDYVDQDDDDRSSWGCDHHSHDDVVEGDGTTNTHPPPPPLVDDGCVRRIVIGHPPSGGTTTTTTTTRTVSDDGRMCLAWEDRIISGAVMGEEENNDDVNDHDTNEDGGRRPRLRLDDVVDIVVYDCRLHSRAVVALLGRASNLVSLTLYDHGGDEYDVRGIEELEWMLARLGSYVVDLSRLAIEFEYRLVGGTRLSFLRCMRKLEHLRLRGFDLSDGMSNLSSLTSLGSLHLCHGNSNAIPNNDVDEGRLLCLVGMASNLRRVHLEGFEGLSHVGLRPFLDVSSSIDSLVLRHCRGIDGDALGSFGRSKHLTSLHIARGPCDDEATFGPKDLRGLNSLHRLRCLSLVYVLGDASDLWSLRGLTSLEYLNVAIVNDAGMALDSSEDDDRWRELCRSRIVPAFPSLRRLRILAGGCNVAARTCRYGRLDVEFAAHNHDDLTFFLD